MASTNQSPFYQRAEQEFLEAKTDEDRIACLDIMIKECPKHKSSENMLKNLTTRRKKIQEGFIRKKKAGKSSQQGIKKADMQCILIGFPNSGKSTIFNILTNTKQAKVSQTPYSTYTPKLGTFDYEDVKIQIIDDAPIPNNEKSIINSTDTLLIIINKIKDIEKIEKYVWKSTAKKIYIYNKEDQLTESEKRKIVATLKSKYKKLYFIFFSQKITKRNLNLFKKKIFETFPIIRIYTKEPNRKASKDPMILRKYSKVKTAAEKILKGFSKNIIRSRIWGPSSKFGGQSVGVGHTLKDKDVIEFKAK